MLFDFFLVGHRSMLRHALQNVDKPITLDFLVNVGEWQCYWKKTSFHNDLQVEDKANIFLFGQLLKKYNSEKKPVWNQQMHNKLISSKWTNGTSSLAVLSSKKYILNNMPKQLKEVFTVFESRAKKWQQEIKSHQTALGKYEKQQSKNTKKSSKS